MWLIADEGDPQAATAFVKRHPEHERELMRRIQMVRAIKGTRPEQASPKQARFAPSMEIPEYREPTRRWPMIALGFGLATVAFGSYFVTQQAFSRDTDPTVSAAAPIPVDPAPTPTVTEPFTQPAPAPAPQPSPAPIVSNNRYDKLVDLSSQETTLFAVLNDIQAQTGLEITVLPGLQNVPLALNYVQTPALRVIQDLGIKFQFSVFEQGPNEVLLVPATDPSKQENDGATDIPNIGEAASGETEQTDIIDPAP